MCLGCQCWLETVGVLLSWVRLIVVLENSYMSNDTHSRINLFIYPVKKLLNFFFFLWKCVSLHNSQIYLFPLLECVLFSVFCACVPLDVLKGSCQTNKKLLPGDIQKIRISSCLFTKIEIGCFILKRNCFYMLLCFFVEWSFNNNNSVILEKLPFWQTCLPDKCFCWFCLPQPAHFFFLQNKKKVGLKYQSLKE